jgi:hypothetical protein
VAGSAVPAVIRAALVSKHRSRRRYPWRTGIVALAAVALLALAAPPAESQGNLARADSLLRAGAIGAAESIFYSSARAQPRDPAARLALGRYLAARGATRVGAVLIEEAREFGLDPEVAATHLAPLYVRLGDYRTLARLAPSPVPLHQRSRVRWMATNPPAVSGADSAVLHTRAGDARTLFSFPAVLLGDTVWISVETGMVELTLHQSLATNAAAEFFGTQDDRHGVATLRELRVGGMRMINVPAKFERTASRTAGRVGIDFLRQFSPTYDPAARLLVLRRTGRIGRPPTGDALPILHEATAVFVVIGGRLQPVFAEQPARLLRERRWSWNARRGVLLVE